MTENANVAAQAANEEAMSEDDLAIVQKIADESKSEEDIWREISGEAPVEETVEPTKETQELAAPENDGAADKAEPEPQPDGASDDTGQKPDEAGSTEGDIWANAPPELREAHQALEQKYKSVNGRVAAYQRQAQQMAQPAVPPPTGRRPAKQGSAIDRIAGDFPDIAEPVKEEISALRSELDEMRAAEERRRLAEHGSYAARVNAETAILDSEMPGWDDYMTQHQAAFAAWVDDQPKAFREAAARNAQDVVNAAEAKEVIEGFRKFMGDGQAEEPKPKPKPDPKLEAKRQRQLDATAAPASTKVTPVETGIPKDGDPEAIWNAIIAKERVEKARASR